MISFTTRNRPKVLEYSLRKTREVYDGPVLVIDDNSQSKALNASICQQFDTKLLYNERRLGIPRSKDRGFNELLSYDFQIWLDDDCYIKTGVDRIIEAMEYQGHILHLKPWAFIKVKKEYPHGLVSYTGATACLMTFRKDMYDDVKGFAEGFSKYGHWHSRLSQKLAKYGLDEYVALENSSDHCHSFDLDGLPVGFKHHFNSCMSSEERQKELQSWKK